MFSERTRQRLADIVENCDRITSYTSGYSLDRFQQDSRTVDAVERCFSRITEAIIQLGEVETELTGLGVVWTEIRGLGNRLRHEYRRIDPRFIFDSVQDDIPPLRDAAFRALEN